MESKLLHNTMQYNEQDKQEEGGEKWEINKKKRTKAFLNSLFDSY